ncbi:MAG: PAS domain S-box protein [Promethearchaeota archaeon]
METLRKDIREKFEELFENILYYVLVYNFEGMIIDVNQLMLNSFGYKTEDVLNKPFKEFIKKENLPQAINAIKDLRKKGRISKPSVYQIKHANGSFKFVEIYGIPFKKNGKIQAVIALGHDITDKKIAEQRLKESELRFRTAIESLPFDFFALDKNEEYVMQNSICKKNWGDIIGKKPEDIVSDEKILQIWKNNNERALSGNLIEGEVSFVMKNEERFFYNIISPIKNENDIQGILGVNIDITEKKRAEQKIKESEKKYRDLFDSSPYSIVLIDLDGIIVDVNETSRTILGYERDEVIGTNFLELPLYEPHAIPMLKERLKMYASGKKMRPITLSLKKKMVMHFG